MKKFLKVLLSILLALVIIFGGLILAGRGFNDKDVTLDKDDWNTNYTYVFVHGLSGWGSYDKQYKFMPYWGTSHGDLMKRLQKDGFTCAAASVAPHGSAWDRACELYAQLTGTRVDYGKAHSKKYHHDRFGEDFTGRALIGKWDAKNKINLLGHSFGGATIRLFSELMANGDKAEQKATEKDDISPFFTGGKADYIYSMTALAAPHNGTTAYHVGTDEAWEGKENLTAGQKFKDKVSLLLNAANSESGDGRADSDYAHYDMNIDHAAKLNERIEMLENVYYFSYPASSTVQQKDGTWVPDTKRTEVLFQKASRRMGSFTGKTKGGIVLDETWQENDGLVNTISATAPFNNKSKPFDPDKFDPDNMKPGIWYVMPVYPKDHMSFNGGLTKRNDIYAFYAEQLNRINLL